MEKINYIINKYEKGFALPSVLFLVTILSLLAASVIMLHYFLRQTSLIEVAKVKAEYAAESVIAKTISQLKSGSNLTPMLLSGLNKNYQFEDGSEANTEVKPWGAYLVVKSEGRFRKVKATQTALLAEHAIEQFENALYFANSTHQLVFTGNSSIKGDVLVGQSGVTIGNLKNYTSPLKIPVEGKISKTSKPEVPVFNAPSLFEELQMYMNLLSKTKDEINQNPNTIYLSSKSSTTINQGMINDSVKYVFISCAAIIQDSIMRREMPLYIIVHGEVVIKNPSRLSGLVAIISSEKITVEKDVTVNQSILCSRQQVEIQPDAVISCQIISPSILVHNRVIMKYPSIIFSTHFNALDTTKQYITISDDARVEGFVGMKSTIGVGKDDQLITLQPKSKVVGAVYTDSRISLDGTVIGTVITKDFYFYESPTTYYGWLRSAVIDRTKLPSGYLIPPGLSENLKLYVLDWL